MLRKKLLPHGIEITTLWGFGYGLHREAREKLRQQLATYDAKLIPVIDRPRSKPKAPPKRRARTDQESLAG